MNLINEIAPDLADFFTQKGVRVIEEKRCESFGNVLVTMECEAFFVRIATDRRTILIDFQQPGETRWHTLENVLEFLTSAPPTDLMRDFVINFPVIKELMNSNLDERGLRAFEKEKQQAVIRRLLSKK